MHVPQPTYGNHGSIYKHSGWGDIHSYTYYNPKNKGLDFEGLKKSVKEIPKGSVITLHACAHNPTGVDPTNDEWNVIADLCAERELFPFFDFAYQGFATGDCDADAYAIRLFYDRGFNMAIAVSFAKNMGLYGERTGCLHIVCDNKDIRDRI
ncbi:hypothetical protein COB52_00255 [Candidatus Kaiserbacteria bacterium]|nr:MAG: hypothetical protein COB52_00255 [Candidatus Kaiserbacteria bacterium]